jgi:hypothetical protein
MGQKVDQVFIKLKVEGFELDRLIKYWLVPYKGLQFRTRRYKDSDYAESVSREYRSSSSSLYLC